ncbi:MAG: fucose isomerase, partial [Victivallales bacterium]|nr:fucose isomerase [Victivallales bacterium]
RDQMLMLAEENALDGLAVQEFTSLVDALGGYCCYSESCVGNSVPIGFESDIHGAISNVLLARAALGTTPPYLADLTIRHPDNDNGILLWHCGAPTDLCHPDDTIRIGRHWILPSPLSGMTHFKMKDGPITAARFDGEHGDYLLAVGEGKAIEGPETLNNYLWMEVNNWPHWEKTFMQGPFIHHTGMIHGRLAHVLREACKYIPGLTFLDLDA